MMKPQSKPVALLILALSGWTLDARALDALPDRPPVPKDNKMTPAKIELGKQLFFEKRLSHTSEVSCNSCHDVTGSGTDNQPFSTGIKGQKGGRNSPTVWNAAFMGVQFWDGRAASLEEQAKGPMINPLEMGMPSHDEVVKRLSDIPEYRKRFTQVFGKNSLNIDNVARALAAYERTLITPNSPYDQFLKGNFKAMSPNALSGLKLVQTVGCTACHFGATFNGPQRSGTGFYQKFPLIPGSEYEKKYKLTEDAGRFNATKNELDRGMWRVPTWRNVALTAPYFHNGSVPTLDEAVRVMAKTQLGKGLTEEQVRDIVAFLKSLTGERPKQTVPAPL
ncbi:MAG: cytochrome-c peroxidase [Deltaproteobacteria bacterium]|nr:cytochrome-c peroxidase [Deltaproteobacteria bacterium]